MKKTCKECGKTKSESQFPLEGGRRRSKCGVCWRRQQREYYWATKGTEKAQAQRYAARRKHDLKRKYGVSVEQYESMFKAQGGRCAICRQLESSGGRLAVDHCHATKRLGALLCGACNRGLGFFRDDTELLRRAIDYLTEHR